MSNNERTVTVNKTYQVVSPESAEFGDFEDTGFEYEDRELTLRELVTELEDFLYTSESRDFTENTWVISGDDQDYRTGNYTSYGLHLSHNSTDRQKRIWVAALNFLFN